MPKPTNRGYIYILLDTCNPSRVKIAGTQKDPASCAYTRARGEGPSRSWYPIAFWRVSDCALAEQRAHALFNNKRAYDDSPPDIFYVSAAESVRHIRDIANHLCDEEERLPGLPDSFDPIDVLNVSTLESTLQEARTLRQFTMRKLESSDKEILFLREGIMTAKTEVDAAKMKASQLRTKLRAQHASIGTEIQHELEYHNRNRPGVSRHNYTDVIGDYLSSVDTAGPSFGIREALIRESNKPERIRKLGHKYGPIISNIMASEPSSTDSWVAYRKLRSRVGDGPFFDVQRNAAKHIVAYLGGDSEDIDGDMLCRLSYELAAIESDMHPERYALSNPESDRLGGSVPPVRRMTGRLWHGVDAAAVFAGAIVLLVVVVLLASCFLLRCSSGPHAVTTSTPVAPNLASSASKSACDCPPGPGASARASRVRKLRLCGLNREPRRAAMANLVRSLYPVTQRSRRPVRNERLAMAAGAFR